MRYKRTCYLDYKIPFSNIGTFILTLKQVNNILIYKPVTLIKEVNVRQCIEYFID